MKPSSLTPRRAADSLIGRPFRDSCRIVVLINLLVIVLAVWVGLPLGDLKHRTFGAMTVAHAIFSAEIICTIASFVQLLITAHVVRQIYRVRRDQSEKQGSGTKSWMLWLLMCIGFVYLAIDEIAFLHEGIDKLIHWVLRLRETRLTDRLDDIIPVFYALIGVGVFIRFRSEMLRFRTAWPFLAVGFAFFFAMVGLDVITNRKDVLQWWLADAQRASFWWGKLTALEEGCKLMAEASFLISFLRCVGTAGRVVPAPHFAQLAKRAAAAGDSGEREFAHGHTGIVLGGVGDHLHRGGTGR